MNAQAVRGRARARGGRSCRASTASGASGVLASSGIAVRPRGRRRLASARTWSARPPLLDGPGPARRRAASFAGRRRRARRREHAAAADRVDGRRPRRDRLLLVPRRGRGRGLERRLPARGRGLERGPRRVRVHRVRRRNGARPASAPTGSPRASARWRSSAPAASSPGSALTVGLAIVEVPAVLVAFALLGLGPRADRPDRLQRRGQRRRRRAGARLGGDDELRRRRARPGRIGAVAHGVGLRWGLVISRRRSRSSRPRSPASRARPPARSRPRPSLRFPRCYSAKTGYDIRVVTTASASRRVQPRVVDRDRGLARERRRQLLVALVERALALVDHLDHADRPVARGHRHGEHVPRLEAGLLVDAAVEPLVRLRVVDDAPARRSRRPSRRCPGRRGRAARSTASPGLPGRDLDGQLAALLVESSSELVSAPVSSVADAHDLAEQLVQLQRRVQVRRDLEQPLERRRVGLSSRPCRVLLSSRPRRARLRSSAMNCSTKSVVTSPERNCSFCEDPLVERDRRLHAAPRDLELGQRALPCGRSPARGRAPRRSASRSASRRTG